MVKALHLVFLLFPLFLLSPNAYAQPIVWSEATIYLDSLTFSTTGDLNVSFPHSKPRGTFTLRDEVYYEDIYYRPTNSGEYSGLNYWAGGNYGTYAEKTWNFTSTGSGVLEIGLDFYWEFNALSGYEPHTVLGGPDNVVVSVSVNNVGLAHYQINAPPDDWHSGRYISLWSRPDYYFNEGEITSLSLHVWTNANGVWHEKPNSAPVPEPSTMLLFGTGLAGLAAVGKRRRN